MLTQAMRPRWALVFPLAYVAVWVWAAIRPAYFDGWLIENILVWAGVPVLYFIDRWQRFSVLSLALLTLFMSLHSVGSHWTYSYVPGPWEKADHSPMGEFFTFGAADGRNFFDRIVHFLYGLLLAPIAVQLLVDRKWAKPAAAWTITIMAVLATGALYEIIEMIGAFMFDPDNADRFLGQQGDSFDAVKDMALALEGALLALGIAMVWKALRRPAVEGRQS